MAPTPLWARSYAALSGMAASPHARWFSVESRTSHEQCTLVEFDVADEAAAASLVTRLEAWDDPAAVRVTGGGVDGGVAWLIYAGQLSDEITAPDPMAAADVTTLGLELCAVMQRARQAGLSTPPLHRRLIVHEFLPDGAFRPRLIGIGTPGPARDEEALAAEIGAIMFGAVIARSPESLGWVPGLPPPMSFQEGRGGRMPPELEQVISDAMLGNFETLDQLRAELSNTNLARGRRGARVAVVTDRYALGGVMRDTGKSGLLPILSLSSSPSTSSAQPPPVAADAEAPSPTTKRRLWPFALGGGSALIALLAFVLSSGSDSITPTINAHGGRDHPSIERQTVAPVGATRGSPPPEGRVVGDSDALTVVAADAAVSADVAVQAADTTRVAAVEDAGPEAGQVDRGSDTMLARAVEAGEPPADKPDPAPAPAPIDVKPAATSAIMVKSKPPNALVFLDNEAIGRTPFTFRMPIDRFPLTLRFEKQGHASHKETLEDPNASSVSIRMRASTPASRPPTAPPAGGEIILDR